MNFTKMHGTGNDYVFVNCFDETVPHPPDLARRVSDRHTGIGADGLILIRPSTRAAVRMEMYNADGSRARMCGNGLRCVAKYAYDHGLTHRSSVPVDTDDGVKFAECTVERDRVTRVTVDMGTPRFAPADLPVNLPGDAVLDAPIEINGRSFRMTCVSMGNPHAVIFVDALNAVALEEDGSAIERHPMFPDRVNTHFVEVPSRDRVAVRTWERGSGRTRACGTGAAAVVVAAARTGRTDRRITVSLEGGELQLVWAPDDHVFMTGPAVEVFQGVWPPHA